VKIPKKSIKKTSIFLLLQNVLVPGSILKSVPKETAKAMEFLQKLQKDGLVELFLIVGQLKEPGSKVLEKSSFARAFSEKNIFFVTQDYINSKEPFDKERHLASLEKDPGFIDEFFKQKVILDLIEKGRVKRESSVLIAHDMWLDGFYTSRFSKIDFVLLKESLSEKNVPVTENIRWLNVISFTEKDLVNVILSKLPAPDLALLETRIFNRMNRELLSGTDFSGLVKKVSQAKKGQ